MFGMFRQTWHRISTSAVSNLCLWHLAIYFRSLCTWDSHKHIQLILLSIDRYWLGFQCAVICQNTWKAGVSVLYLAMLFQLRCSSCELSHVRHIQSDVTPHSYLSCVQTLALTSWYLFSIYLHLSIFSQTWHRIPTSAVSKLWLWNRPTCFRSTCTWALHKHIKFLLVSIQHVRLKELELLANGCNGFQHYYCNELRAWKIVMRS